MDGHYDRDADIAWLRLDGWDPQRVRVEERPWGLLELERDNGCVVGLEYWKASERLPSELLEALPEPPAHPWRSRASPLERDPDPVDAFSSETQAQRRPSDT